MYIYGKQIQLANKPDFNLLIFIYFLLDAKCPSRLWCLLFCLFSTQLTNSSVISQKSVPLGMYCLMNQFVFSLAPRPHPMVRFTKIERNL